MGGIPISNGRGVKLAIGLTAMGFHLVIEQF
jgi:hypothetical protein